ncbi:MAG TPA: hypothetical protein VK327_11575 [Candidatus Paceibacterota bacterium]|nr:hypothetical protein [Candidatus Paceibacterota bacterium]
MNRSQNLPGQRGFRTFAKLHPERLERDWDSGTGQRRLFVQHWKTVRWMPRVKVR